MAEGQSQIEKVARWWAESPEERMKRSIVVWMDHPHIKRHINRRTTGDESLDWLNYVIQKYLEPPIESGLSLGCGGGGLERHALWAESVGHFDAYDVSPDAIESAKRAAKEAGVYERINYLVMDLNEVELPLNAYDAVFASMSIHHVEALERVFEGVRNALRPRGRFIINEYIGPSRFQLSPVQCQLINDLIKIIPQRLRKTIRGGRITSEVKTSHEIHPLTWFDENDPSEAVRSAEIIPFLKNYFKIIEFRPYGGALLQFVVENIVGNFDNNKEDDRAWLDMLTFVERKLEDCGVIESDFALVVAEPKVKTQKPLRQIESQ